MYDLTIDDFPPDRLAEIVRWRNDPAVNKYLRPGIRTLKAIQEWYAQYFSQTENKLFAVYADKTLICSELILSASRLDYIADSDWDYVRIGTSLG